MRLSGLTLAAVLLCSTSYMLAQHSSGGGGGSGSSGGSSSGGGGHSSSSAGSSGGSSGGHSTGGSSGGSHSSGSSHSSGGSHTSGGGHATGSSSAPRGSGSHGSNNHGSSLTTTTQNGTSLKNPRARSIHEPKAGLPSEKVAPEKRGFFSVLFHPFRKVHPKPEPKPALYLPRPICPHGRCAPPCPVGQARSGGACTTPVIPACASGRLWNGKGCNLSRDYHCRFGEVWNGITCTNLFPVLDNCFALRNSLQRQTQRVQAAESIRRSACANGPAQECSQATSTWQSEENMRQNMLARYQRCQMQYSHSYSGRYDPLAFDSTPWLDSLRFNADF